METSGSLNDGENFGEQPCKYRDLNDPDKAEESEKFFAQYSELPEDSPQMEEAEGRPICDRPSCLLNLRIALSYTLRPGKQETIEDFSFAVPPECEWRKQTDMQSNS